MWIFGRFNTWPPHLHHIVARGSVSMVPYFALIKLSNLYFRVAVYAPTLQGLQEGGGVVTSLQPRRQC